MDPISAQLGKATLERATPPVSKSSSGTGEASSFQKMLDFQSGQNDPSPAQLMEFVDNTFGMKPEAMNAVDASSVHVDVSKVQEVEKGPSVDYLKDLMKDFNQEQNYLQNLKEIVSSGRTFKPAELIHMQFTMQELIFKTELTSKVVESGTRLPNTMTNMNLG